MQILFEDYIRYRKEKIRERLKSAVTEQFMAAHPEAGPKAVRRFKKKQAYHDMLDQAVKADEEYIYITDPAHREETEQAFAAEAESLEKTLTKYAQAREKRQLEKKLRELTGAGRLRGDLEARRDDYLDGVVEAIEYYFRTRNLTMHRVKNTHFGRQTWEEPLSEKNIKEFTESFTMDDDSGWGGKKTINFGLKMDRDAGRYQLDLTVSMPNGAELPVSVYVDGENLLLASEPLLGDEVLSLPLKDFGKEWNKSPLAAITGVKLPETLSIPELTSDSVPKMLEKTFGDDWEEFEESVEMTEDKNDKRFSDLGTAYVVSYDEKLLEDLAETAEKNLETLSDIEEPSDLEKIDFEEVIASAIVMAIREAAGQIEELTYCTNDDCMVGLYVKTEDGDFELRLEGEENPWEEIVFNADGEKGRITTKISNGELTITGMNPDYPEEAATITYRDSDGSITLSHGGDVVSNADVNLVPTDDGFRLITKSNWDDGDYYSNSSETIEFSTDVGSISAPAGKVTNLLALSVPELQALAQRISHASGLEIFSDLFGDIF